VIVLRVPGGASADVLQQIKLAAKRFPGPHTLCLDVQAGYTTRRVTLGPDWRYSDSEGCLAALSEFGSSSRGPLDADMSC
jgi:hypothetical protein